LLEYREARASRKATRIVPKKCICWIQLCFTLGAFEQRIVAVYDDVIERGIKKVGSAQVQNVVAK